MFWPARIHAVVVALTVLIVGSSSKRRCVDGQMIVSDLTTFNTVLENLRATMFNDEEIDNLYQGTGTHYAQLNVGTFVRKSVDYL